MLKPPCNWASDSCTPIGAGMVMRRSVAEFYLDKTIANHDHMILDRKGDSLMSGGDIDMAYCSFDLSMGIGVFPQLRLKHLIPSSRLERNYVAKLARSMVSSAILLESIHGKNGRIRHIFFEGRKTLLEDNLLQFI